jgi:hypothetical protein
LGAGTAFVALAEPDGAVDPLCVPLILSGAMLVT